MPIREYTLGSGTKSDRDLFAWTGHWLLDVETHKALGNAITSEDGDRWYVMTPEKGRARGFAVTRDSASEGKRHLRYLHADTQMTRMTLLKRTIEAAKTDGISWLWARERKNDPDLQKAGFESAEYDPNGRKTEFCRWDLMLGDKK